MLRAAELPHRCSTSPESFAEAEDTSVQLGLLGGKGDNFSGVGGQTTQGKFHEGLALR